MPTYLKADEAHRRTAPRAKRQVGGNREAGKGKPGMQEGGQARPGKNLGEWSEPMAGRTEEGRGKEQGAHKSGRLGPERASGA